MTLLYRAYDKREYANITSLTFIPTLIAPTMAPFLGGVLLDYYGWRSVFAFSGPICLLAALLSAVILQEEPQEKTTPFDWGGFFLSSGLLIDTFYTLSLISRQGNILLIAIGSAGFFVLLAAFIVWEKSNHYPLIDLSLFKNSVFVKANLIQICFQSCHFGAIFLIGLYLQVALGFSATLTGLIMGMQGLGAILISRYSVKLINQHGPKVPLSVGLAGVALVSPGILLIPLFKGITFGIILFFIRGLFSGLCGTPIQVLSVLSFSKEQMSQVNTLFNICRQVAISLGIAIYAILIAISLQYHHIASLELIQRPQIVGVFILGSLSISLLAMTGLLIANSIGPGSMTSDR